MNSAPVIEYSSAISRGIALCAGNSQLVSSGWECSMGAESGTDFPLNDSAFAVIGTEVCLIHAPGI